MSHISIINRIYDDYFIKYANNSTQEDPEDDELLKISLKKINELAISKSWIIGNSTSLIILNYKTTNEYDSYDDYLTNEIDKIIYLRKLIIKEFNNSIYDMKK